MLFSIFYLLICFATFCAGKKWLKNLSELDFRLLINCKVRPKASKLALRASNKACLDVVSLTLIAHSNRLGFNLIPSP